MNLTRGYPARFTRRHAESLRQDSVCRLAPTIPPPPSSSLRVSQAATAAGNAPGVRAAGNASGRVGCQRGGAPRVHSTATIYVGGRPRGAQVKISGVTDCLFCGIAAGDVPAARVLEGPRTMAFRDINPQAPVHVLVIPTSHYLARQRGGRAARRTRRTGPRRGGGRGNRPVRVPGGLQYWPRSRANRAACPRPRPGRPGADLAAGMTAASSMTFMRPCARRGRTIDR